MLQLSCSKDESVARCSSCSVEKDLILPKREPDYRFIDNHTAAQAVYDSLNCKYPCALWLTYERDYDDYCRLFDDIYIGELNENGDCIF